MKSENECLVEAYWALKGAGNETPTMEIRKAIIARMKALDTTEGTKRYDGIVDAVFEEFKKGVDMAQEAIRAVNFPQQSDPGDSLSG